MFQAGNSVVSVTDVNEIAAREFQGISKGVTEQKVCSELLGLRTER